MRHWNRGRKTARNLLLALLLVFLIHASQGFPPYTARGMCRQFRHDYLLGELEPLYVQRDWVRPHRKNYHYTTIAARSGETYALFRYEDSLLGSHRDWSDFRPVLGEGFVCAANRGTIYAAGPFEGAAYARAVIRAEKAPEPNGKVKTRTFTLAGERLADQVFAFPYEREYSQSYWDNQNGEPYDYRDLTLYDIVNLWYRKPAPDTPHTYYLEDTEIPCTVTLYGESGEVLESFPLSVTTEGLLSYR